MPNEQWSHDMHGALIVPRNCALHTFDLSTTIPRNGEILIAYENNNFTMKIGNGKDVFKDLAILATTYKTSSDGEQIDLTNYVKYDDLNNYVSQDECKLILKNYATKEELNNYLLKEDFDISLFAKSDDLNNYVTIDKFNEVIDSLTKGEFHINIATVEKTGVVKPDGTTITITDDGTISAVNQTVDIDIATTEKNGILRPDGNTINITNDGVISANIQNINIATNDEVGIVKPDGNTITITEDGTITSNVSIATDDIFGIVKPDGSSITIKDGIISSVNDITIATNDKVGIVKPDGSSITIKDDGTISSNINIATINDNGIVKPDGTSITITEDGTISANIEIPEEKEYTIIKLDNPEDGYSVSYQLMVDNTKKGDTINIPKDLVVESGEVKTVTEADQPVEGFIVGDKYIDLLLANSDDKHIYILASDLVDDTLTPDGKTTFLKTITTKDDDGEILSSNTYLYAVGYNADNKNIIFNGDETDLTNKTTITNSSTSTSFGSRNTIKNSEHSVTMGTTNSLNGVYYSLVTGSENVIGDSSNEEQNACYSLITGHQQIIQSKINYLLMYGSQNKLISTNSTSSHNNSLIGGFYNNIVPATNCDAIVGFNINIKDNNSNSTTGNIIGGYNNSLLGGSVYNIIGGSNNSITNNTTENTYKNTANLVHGQQHTFTGLTTNTLISGSSNSSAKDSTDAAYFGSGNKSTGYNNQGIIAGGSNTVINNATSFITGTQHNINNLFQSIATGSRNTVTGYLSASVLAGGNATYTDIYNSFVSASQGAFYNVNSSLIISQSGGQTSKDYSVNNSIVAGSQGTLPSFQNSLFIFNSYRPVPTSVNYSLFNIDNSSLSTYVANTNLLKGNEVDLTTSTEKDTTNNTVNSVVVGKSLDLYAYIKDSAIFGSEYGVVYDSNLTKDGDTKTLDNYILECDLISGNLHKLKGSIKYTTISGSNNSIGTKTQYSNISGSGNTITGDKTVYNSSIILSGTDNKLFLENSDDIVSGTNNQVPGSSASIISGSGNLAGGGDKFSYSIISGISNKANRGGIGSVLFGNNNTIIDSFIQSMVFGLNNTTNSTLNMSLVFGSSNTAGGLYQSLLTGLTNNIQSANQSIISGSSNYISDGVNQSIVMGKSNNINSVYSSLIISGSFKVNYTYNSILGSTQFVSPTNVNSTIDHTTYHGKTTINNTSSTINTLLITKSIISGEQIINCSNNNKIINSFISGSNNTFNNEIDNSLIVGSYGTFNNVNQNIVYLGYGKINNLSTTNSIILAGKGNTVKNIWMGIISGYDITFGTDITDDNTNQVLSASIINGNAHNLVSTIYQSIVSGQSNIISNGSVFNALVTGVHLAIKGSIYNSIISGQSNEVNNVDEQPENYNCSSSFVTGSNNNLNNITNSLILGSNNTVNSINNTLILGSNNKVISNYNSLVLGTFNEDDTDKFIIVGNGESDTARKNIMSLDKSGNMQLNTILIHKTDDDTDYVDIRTLLNDSGDIDLSNYLTLDGGIVSGQLLLSNTESTPLIIGTDNIANAVDRIEITGNTINSKNVDNSAILKLQSAGGEVDISNKTDANGILKVYGEINATKYTGGLATTTTDGLMSSTDKTNLDSKPGKKISGETVTGNIIDSSKINSSLTASDICSTSKYTNFLKSVSVKASNTSEIFNTTIGSSANKAYMSNSHAEGIGSFAYGTTSHAEGNGSIAQGTNSHAEGQLTFAYGADSHAEGYLNIAYGNYSHAEGYNNFIYSNYSHAEGYNNTISGTHSHAEGSGNTASGNYSHVEGRENTASTDYSHVEGYNNKSSEKYSHAEGNGNTVSGDCSHVEGGGNTASGTHSHAEGGGNTASGLFSHAEGSGNTASGNYSHAGGKENTASGKYSFTSGLRTVSSGEATFSIGKYNYDNNGAYLFAIGNGTLKDGVTESSSLTENDILRSNIVDITETDMYLNGYLNFNRAQSDRFNTKETGIKLRYNNQILATIMSTDGTSSGCSVGSTSAKFGSSYITNMYGTIKGSADYAEFMEWEDGNKDNEDRRGLLVALSDNENEDNESTIVLANKDSDIIGIVSSDPIVLGDSYDNDWHNKYKTDIFGKKITEKKLIAEEVLNEDGTVKYEAVYDDVDVISDDYDETKVYVPRKDRQEWDMIGFLGKLICIDDGTCKKNKYVTAINGIATYSEEKTNIRMIKRIDETHIKVLIL